MLDLLKGLAFIAMLLTPCLIASTTSLDMADEPR
jgi:hypothetical protein